MRYGTCLYTPNMHTTSKYLTSYAEYVYYNCVGFPRTIEQARLLDEKIKFNFVLNIEVPFPVIIDRLKVVYNCIFYQVY